MPSMSAPENPHPAGPRRYRPLFILLALLFLLEAWIWRHMEPVVQWVANLLPFERLKALVARWARGLPAYGALALFLSPLLLAEPLEGIAVWAYAHHRWVLGSLSLLAVKLVGVGVMAFLFAACEEQLLSIGWFARVVALFLAIKHWAEAEVAPLKARIAAWRAYMVARMRASRGGLWRRIALLRRWMFARGRG